MEDLVFALITDLVADTAEIAKNASPAQIDAMIEQLRQKGIEQPEWKPLLLPVMARLAAEHSLREAAR